MDTPTRTTTNAAIVKTSLRGKMWLSHHELAAAAGISPARLSHLLRLGLVEEQTAAEPGVFMAATAARLRRMLRVHDDLEVDLVGATIIADLLERVERLEIELARLRGRP